MEKKFNVIQVLNNLNSIKRTGPNLFAGISSEHLDSIAEHSYRVTYLCLLLGQSMDGVNVGNLLTNAIVHDWGESIIGDIPSGSRSYKSYFEDDISAIFKKAESRALDELIDDAGIKVPELSEKEKEIFSFCDKLSVAIEVINMKQQGFTHAWLDLMFEVQIKLLKKSPLEFTNEVVEQLENLFNQGGMDNVYLTKATRNS